MNMGFGSGLWGTYRQFAAMGAQVRKGERATTVVFWKEFRRGESDENDGGDTDERDADDNRRVRFMARGYHVFNAAQVDGLEIPTQPVLPECARIAAAEQFFVNLGIAIKTKGDQACYVPRLDQVRIPPFARFRDARSYYSTLRDGMGHATGAKLRLNRDLGGRFGSECCAMDEQIAELTASFVMADLGLRYGARPESAAYLASWLKVLKNDTERGFSRVARHQSSGLRALAD
jgi:antirestriction protein ArdC